MASLIDTNKSIKDFKSSHFRKSMVQMSDTPICSRIYKNINEQKGENYYNYTALEVKWGKENNYEVTKKNRKRKIFGGI